MTKGTGKCRDSTVPTLNTSDLSLDILRKNNLLPNGRVLMMTLGGSHAYGTARADSDLDLRGVYQVPTRRLFEINSKVNPFQRTNPDCVIHELGNFCRLAAASNPNILEILWYDDLDLSRLVQNENNLGWKESKIQTPAGELLRTNRKLFLSQRVAKTYQGYAFGQLRKAQAIKSQVQHPIQREKYIGHIYRLMEQGRYILENGDLQVKVTSPDEIKERSKQSLEQLEKDFKVLEHRIKTAASDSDLPENPDIEAINDLLVELRLKEL
jgi:predicted nucleotidyltransferase